MKKILLACAILMFVGQACKPDEPNEIKPPKLKLSTEGDTQGTPEIIRDPYPQDELWYHNRSDYYISMYRYHRGDRSTMEIFGLYPVDGSPVEEDDLVNPGIYYLQKEPYLMPKHLWIGLNDRYEMKENVKEQVGAHVPLYFYNGICDPSTSGQGGDSIRIYFNENKPDERYVTYKREEGFKPRDIRNLDAYKYKYIKKSEDWEFHYTFTNADYSHAKKHQNATPVPISPCNKVSE